VPWALRPAERLLQANQTIFRVCVEDLGLDVLVGVATQLEVLKDDNVVANLGPLLELKGGARLLHSVAVSRTRRFFSLRGSFTDYGFATDIRSEKLGNCTVRCVAE
jgi:hypothetical protein